MGTLCQNCRAPLTDGTRFCAYCGAPTGEGSAPPARPKRNGRRHLAVGAGAIAVIVVAALAIGFLPRIIGSDEATQGQIVRRPEPPALQAASEAMSLAVRHNVYARLVTEEYASAIGRGAAAEEVTALADEAAAAWDAASLAAYGAESITGDAIAVLEEATAVESTSQGAERALQAAFVAPATSAPDAQKWAESLTRQYDHLRGGSRYKQLAEQLGTDARTAYEQMQLAQEILRSDANKDSEFWDTLLKSAQVVKTGSKVGLFITATIATGGGTLGALSTSGFTVAQTAGTIVGGIDCLVDVTETGSTIILGEDSQVALAASEAKKFVGPVSSVFGITGWSDMAKPERMAFVGDALADWFFESKIMGVQVLEDRDGVFKMTTHVFESLGQNALRGSLEAAGFLFPENATITSLKDLMDGVRPDLDATLARLDALAAQMAADQEGGVEPLEPSEPAEPAEPTAPSEPSDSASTPGGQTQPPAQGGIGISGEYTVAEEGPSWSNEYTITLEDNGDGTVTVSGDPWWDGVGSTSYEAEFDTESMTLFLKVAELAISINGDDVTGLGYFYVEGEMIGIGMSRQ